MMNRLEEAILFATVAHVGQLDKANKPYILHPLAVMLTVAMRTDFDEDAMIVAILHDVREDCGISYERIKAQFGEAIADAVESVTRREPKTGYPVKEKFHKEFIPRAKANPLGKIVKDADLDHNLSPQRLAALPVEDQESLRQRYLRAKAILHDSEK